MGKTTILNGVAWCLFGKDIEGNEMGVRIYKSLAPIEEQYAEVNVFLVELNLQGKPPQHLQEGGELEKAG